jgi:hypothetical protein
VYVRQPSSLGTPNILIECTSFQRLYMGLSKHRGHGMLGLKHWLKKAPQAWYARIKTFLLEHGYVMGSLDKTLFTLKYGTNFLFRFTWMTSSLVALLIFLC